jgi:hypothetical protein
MGRDRPGPTGFCHQSLFMRQSSLNWPFGPLTSPEYSLTRQPPAAHPAPAGLTARGRRPPATFPKEGPTVLLYLPRNLA